MSDPLVAELERMRGTEPAAAVALGDGPVEQRLTAALLALARHRGPGSSTCPSDAARAVGGDRWRELTGPARELARRLARAGEVVILQRGTELDPDADWRGPVRVRTAQPRRASG